MPRKKKETLVHLDMDELTQQTAPVVKNEPSAQTLGDILREKRQKKHWDIADVSKASCIKAVYIEALEKGHYYVFPAKAYAIGFLRTYSKMLNLNPEEMVTLYHQETSDDKEEPLDMLVIEKKAALPSKKALFLVILALFVFYVIWYLIANSYSPSTLIQEQPPSVEEKVEVTGEVVVEQPAVEQVAAEPKKTEAPKEIIKEISEKVYTAPLAFVAAERVWVRIKDIQKNVVLLDKTMAKNEDFIPKIPLENLSVSTGRGGALELYIDGIRKNTIKKEDNTPLIELTKD